MEILCVLSLSPLLPRPSVSYPNPAATLSPASSTAHLSVMSILSDSESSVSNLMLILSPTLQTVTPYYGNSALYLVFAILSVNGVSVLIFFFL